MVMSHEPWQHYNFSYETTTYINLEYNYMKLENIASLFPCNQGRQSIL